MSLGMVVCGNGEPDPWGYRYIGPFDGPDHARLWEQTVHKRAGKRCPFDHWIETLEAPTAIPAFQDIVANDLATADVDEEARRFNKEGMRLPPATGNAFDEEPPV